jgi:hypothetical protein
MVNGSKSDENLWLIEIDPELPWLLSLLRQPHLLLATRNVKSGCISRDGARHCWGASVHMPIKTALNAYGRQCGVRRHGVLRTRQTDGREEVRRSITFRSDKAPGGRFSCFLYRWRTTTESR